MSPDPKEFDWITKTIFFPIYPIIARRMLEWSGVHHGICIDIGAGPGSLGRAIAQERPLVVYALDSDPAMLRIACHNALSLHLQERYVPVCGDVCSLPFHDNSAHLIVSRGSIYFWRDRPRAFREIERVLCPGGVAYVGGGFGTAQLRDRIFAKMRSINPEWDARVRERSSRATPGILCEELGCSGVLRWALKREETGLWVEIKKDIIS